MMNEVFHTGCFILYRGTAGALCCSAKWVPGVIRGFSFRFKSSRASRANAATLYLYRLNVNTKVLLALKYTHNVIELE